MPKLIIDALLESLQPLPLLFFTYLLIEWITHRAGTRTQALINRAGRLGPALGGVLGMVPHCALSAATANLYASGIVTRGTLLAVLLSASDEMLPLLIAAHKPAGEILGLLGILMLTGILVGLAADLLCKARQLPAPPERTCRASCCCRHGLWGTAVLRTIHVFLFLFAISLLLEPLISHLGSYLLSAAVLQRPVCSVFLASLLGLLPGCAGSVILTQLYLEGLLPACAMLAGLLVNSGVALPILFRINRPTRDNVLITALLLGSGILGGLLFSLLGG